MNLLIRNVRFINPYDSMDQLTDVKIINGRIQDVGFHLSGDEMEILDATGLVLAPGFIDMHVHLREPGFEYKETILTGMRAAAHGGFTAVAAMPNTNPVLDNPKMIELVLLKASSQGPISILPIGAITKGLLGEQLTDMEALVQSGAVAFSDDGMSVMNSELMRQAMIRANEQDKIVIDHCEDLSLTRNGVIHRGEISQEMGLEGIPSAAEEIMTARDILLAKEYGLPVHIAHVSTRDAVEMVRQAKKMGIKVSAEATPHHFSLTDQSMRRKDANYKVSPPLRSEMDRGAVVDGIIDGTIDIIATDHAPHSEEEKQQSLQNAPKGMIGLETCFAAINTFLIAQQKISLYQAIDMLTRIPHERFKLPKTIGNPRMGKTNLVLLDLNIGWTVRKEDFYSKSSNSPFLGQYFNGKVMMTIAQGEMAMRDDQIKF